MTLQVIQRFGKVFNLNANYTLSHTLDDGTFTTFVSTPQDLYNRPLERANSNQDLRHRFITNFTATAPSDCHLRNFALSNIVTLQSGRPFPCSWNSTPMATPIPSPIALQTWAGTLTTETISIHGTCASLVISKFGSARDLI